MSDDFTGNNQEGPKETFLTPREILDFALEIEKKSVSLYDSLSNLWKEPGIKSLFSFLADEEEKHIVTFKKMKTELNRTEYENIPIPEHIQFLDLHLKSTVFSPEVLSAKLKQIHDIETCFDFAVSVELDQILYYNEIKNYLPEKKHGLIDEIAAEERRHFIRIMQVRQAKGY